MHITTFMTTGNNFEKHRSQTWNTCKNIDEQLWQLWQKHANLVWFGNQRCQPVQIICICPDICAFSVLHNRHCADICTICQKCQFEVRKGWQVLLVQSEAEDMHCKQADSATLKYLLLEFSLNNLFMVKCMVFMHRWCCRDHANYYMSKL